MGQLDGTPLPKCLSVITEHLTRAPTAGVTLVMEHWQGVWEEEEEEIHYVHTASKGL